MVEYDGRVRKGPCQIREMGDLMMVMPGVETQAHVGQHGEAGTKVGIRI